MIMTQEHSGLSPKLYEATIRHIVEDEKTRHSNNDLWTRLLGLYDREVEILKLLPYAMRGSHIRKWKRYYEKLLIEYESTKSMMELIVWHLTQRGDNAIGDWVEHTDAFKRHKESEWQNVAYRSWNKSSEGMVQ